MRPEKRDRVAKSVTRWYLFIYFFDLFNKIKANIFKFNFCQKKTKCPVDIGNINLLFNTGILNRGSKLDFDDIQVSKSDDFYFALCTKYWTKVHLPAMLLIE